MPQDLAVLVLHPTMLDKLLQNMESGGPAPEGVPLPNGPAKLNEFVTGMFSGASASAAWENGLRPGLPRRPGDPRGKDDIQASHHLKLFFALVG